MGQSDQCESQRVLPLRSGGGEKNGRTEGNIINMSTQFAFKAPTIGMGAYAIAKAVL
jgi:NAD(P)-dependent dehydrogenase (short-subunit alcohol dehydrogenase family)